MFCSCNAIDREETSGIISAHTDTYAIICRIGKSRKLKLPPIAFFMLKIQIENEVGHSCSVHRYIYLRIGFHSHPCTITIYTIWPSACRNNLKMLLPSTQRLLQLVPLFPSSATPPLGRSLLSRCLTHTTASFFAFFCLCVQCQNHFASGVFSLALLTLSHTHFDLIGGCLGFRHFHFPLALSFFS